MLFDWLSGCLPTQNRQNLYSVLPSPPEECKMSDEPSVKRSRANSTKKEKSTTVIIWTRISSEKQTGNMSLDMQEREAKKYIETNKLGNNSITLKMVGSGYTVDESIQQNIDLLHCLLEKGDQVLLICYMPDRLLRNYQIASELLDKIETSGGSVHFIKGPEGKPLVTTNSEDMPTILDCLRLAQNDSKLRSQRVQDSKNNAIREKIQKNINIPQVSRCMTFISLFLKGGTVENVYKAFRACVDWDLYPEWKKMKYNRQQTYYQVPFYIDGLIMNADRDQIVSYTTEDDLVSRCKCILHLFKSYKIDLPDVFLPRKRWTVLFVQQLGGIDEVDLLSSKLTAI